ncbi:nucleoside-diphosphate-sugar epimerase [Trichoderma arundinaceum]|uniref:Nucleoside-diphosphate-sugar epimerase n=1 Tax=Trichoderma arundinaceum TaxID=490622 RepID=A0A395P1H2_TRIAR|nr:nucleoside-diphosphate-sugar epimerase [Trichoderma arundinaceum]
MHLILTGATGLIGSSVLDAMLKMTEVTKISILSRRPVAMAEDAKDPRVNVIIHKDFSSYDSEVLNKLRGASGAVWALGVSQTKVSKEEFIKITKDYPLAGAEAFSNLAPNGDPFRFVFVSGQGSTQAPGRFSSLYSRIKGETEVALSEMRIANPRLLADAVGPGFVDGKGHAAIQPYLQNQGFFIDGSKMLVRRPIEVAAKWLHCPTEPMGRFLVGMALGKYEAHLREGDVDIVTLNGGLRIIKNTTITQLASVKV